MSKNDTFEADLDEAREIIKAFYNWSIQCEMDPDGCLAEASAFLDRTRLACRATPAAWFEFCL